MKDVSVEIKRIFDVMTYKAEVYKFNGIFMCKDSKENKIKSFGVSDVDSYRLNTRNTKFRIGSITKGITAMSIMILKSRGLLNIEDELGKYIKNYEKGKNVTIYNLLTHTSGIGEHKTKEFLEKSMGGISIDEIIDEFRHKELLYVPGLKFDYSHSNYVLLAKIIESITKKKYQEFVTENIFIPLGMDNTGFYFLENVDENNATGYDVSYPLFEKSMRISSTAPYGTGDIHSNCEDLIKWDEALYTEKLIPKELMDEYLTPKVEVDERRMYGYGWYFSKKNTDIMYHIGTMPGFATFLIRDKNSKRLGIVLSNDSSNMKMIEELEEYVLEGMI